MRKWNRAIPALLGVLAMTVTLAGCYETDESNGEKNTGSAEQKTTFRLGEASPRQENLASDTKDDTYTVTPTRVETGTKADMDKSGLELDDLPGPRVPVYVWSTLKNYGAQPMRIREMAGDLVLRTEQGDRTKALLVMMGEATWPNCPEPEPEKEVSQGQSEKICTTFLITRGYKPAVVELTQGWHSDPLEWLLKK